MRLIDADRLERKKKYSFQIKGLPFPKSECFIKFSDLLSAPTVNAVEVVRCSECKHGVFSWQEDSGVEHYLCDYIIGEQRMNDFCSYGERKE